MALSQSRAFSKAYISDVVEPLVVRRYNGAIMVRISDDEYAKLQAAAAKLMKLERTGKDLASRETEITAKEEAFKAKETDFARREEILANQEASLKNAGELLARKEEGYKTSLAQLEERERNLSEKLADVNKRETDLAREQNRQDTMIDGLKTREERVLSMERNVAELVANGVEQHKVQLDAAYAERMKKGENELSAVRAKDAALHRQKMDELSRLTAQWNKWHDDSVKKLEAEKQRLEEERQRLAGWQKQLDQYRLALENRTGALEWREERIKTLIKELREGPAQDVTEPNAPVKLQDETGAQTGEGQSEQATGDPHAVAVETTDTEAGGAENGVEAEVDGDEEASQEVDEGEEEEDDEEAGTGENGSDAGNVANNVDVANVDADSNPGTDAQDKGKEGQ